MLRRRAFTAVGIALLAVIPAIAVVVGLLVGDRERIVSYFQVAAVDGNGPTRIHELIDYSFGAASERHGIYRIVPGAVDPASVDVSSPTAPDQVQVTGGQFKIGDPDRTVTGTHRYRIRYDLHTLVVENSLAWNVVGAEWSVDVEAVEAHVVSDRELSDLSCDQGTFGTEGGCEVAEVEPGHVVVRTGPVPAGHAVTLRARLGAPVENPPSLPTVPGPPDTAGAPLLAPAILGWLLAFVAGLITARMLRWAGREHAPAGHVAPSLGLLPGHDRVDAADLVADAPPRIAPPGRLTPAQGGVLLAEKVKDEHKSAWLVSQAQHGAIALTGASDAPMMQWLGGQGAVDNDPLVTMFHGRTSVMLGEYDPSFAAGWKMVGAELDEWRRSSDLWAPEGDRRRKLAIGMGVLGWLIGFVLAGLLAYAWSLSDPLTGQLAALCLPFGVATGLVLGAWELRVRTPEGSALYVEVESFRRHLRDAEAEDVERAAEAGVLHEHLAWAVALGVSSAWTSAARAASLDPRTHAGYDPSMFLIASQLHSSTSSTATAPSSSSSGGGGGGAGGGGGGGGGGSW